jgi:hypothetical protein
MSSTPGRVADHPKPATIRSSLERFACSVVSTARDRLPRSLRTCLELSSREPYRNLGRFKAAGQQQVRFDRVRPGARPKPFNQLRYGTPAVERTCS